MINRNLLAALAAVIIVSLLLWAIAIRPPMSGDQQAGAALFPGLQEELATAEQVTLRTRDSQVTLVRADGRWVVAERDRYAADFGKLAKLLGGIAEARLAERKTARPENYHLLGLRGLDEEGSEAIEVTIALGGAAERRLLVGQSGSGREGTFVRLPDEAQGWLVDQELSVAREATAWLQPSVIDIEAERIARVVMAAPGAAPVEARRNVATAGDLELLGVPGGRKLKYATIANTLGRALVNVRLKDVVAADGFDWEGGGSARFECADGLVVAVRTARRDERFYLHFDASFAPPAAPAAEGAEPATESAAAEAERLAGELAPWVFEVTEYTFDQFAKRMEDLTDPEESAPADASAGR